MVYSQKRNEKLGLLARIGALFASIMSLLAFILTIFMALTEGPEYGMLLIFTISIIFGYFFGQIGFTGKVPKFLNWENKE